MHLLAQICYYYVPEDKDYLAKNLNAFLYYACLLDEHGQAVLEKIPKKQSIHLRAAAVDTADKLEIKKIEKLILEYQQKVLKNIADINHNIQSKRAYLAEYYYVKASNLNSKDSKNIKRKLNFFKKSAKYGNPDAMFELGTYYYNANDEKCVKYFKDAASAGVVRGNVTLAMFYHRGKFVGRNQNQAYEYLKKALPSADPWILYNAGLLYEESNVMAKAIDLYHQAAALNNSDAQYKLGLIYAKGKGTAKDYKKSFDFFNLAARTLPDARYYTALFYKHGVVAKKDEKHAMQIITALAKDKNVPACLFLGKRDLAQRDEKRRKNGIWLLQFASDAGCAEAQYLIGKYYFDQKFYSDAWRYLDKAYKQGYGPASEPYQIVCDHLQAEEEARRARMAANQVHPNAGAGERTRICADCGGKGICEDYSSIHRRWFTTQCRSCQGTGNAGTWGDYIENGQRHRSIMEQRMKSVFGGGGGGIFR